MTEVKFYIARVAYYLNKYRAPSGVVSLEEGEAETPSGTLVEVPPVDSDIVYYRGTFATEDEAIAAIWRDFPGATIDVAATQNARRRL